MIKKIYPAKKMFSCRSQNYTHYRKINLHVEEYLLVSFEAFTYNPASIYMIKVNNGNTRIMCH